MIKLTPKVENPGSSDGMSKAKELSGIKKTTMELLQEQIGHEFFAERLYIAMASWLIHKGYPETGKFFYDHAKEEKHHAKDFIKFILERGEHAMIPETKLPPNEFENEEAIFTAAIDHEKFITQKIADIYAQALEAGDILALNIARKYAKEQQEEETLFASLYALFKLDNAITIDMEIEVSKLTKRKMHIIADI